MFMFGHDKWPGVLYPVTAEYSTSKSGVRNQWAESLASDGVTLVVGFKQS